MRKKRRHSPRCPYCNRFAEFTTSIEVYGKDYGDIYLCRPCRAWVGCHKGTDRPLGRLANKELRDWKIRAHNAFNPLFEAKMRREEISKGKARAKAYKWLSEQLGIEGKYCHIGMFDVETCKRVVEVCSPYLQRINA